MKLLIVTQKVNIDDPILGFFHRWIEEFAKKCEKVTVICLEKGKYNLPENVKVLSLGKERGNSRFDKVCWLYQYIWEEKSNYDRVFVHMNQEYVVLAGLMWRLMKKKIYLWRNHAKGSALTQLAILLSHKVFYTSSQSYTARFKKAQVMPVGIDTEFFKPDDALEKIPRSILFLGRVSPVKKTDLFVDSLCEMKRLGVTFKATVVGETLPSNENYKNIVRHKSAEGNLRKNIEFIGGVNQEKARKLFREHELYVNLTPPGSLDKAIFEAMACGSKVVVVNPDLRDQVGERYMIEDLNPVAIGKKIGQALESALPLNLREFVVKNHSLEILVNKIIKA